MVHADNCNWKPFWREKMISIELGLKYAASNPITTHHGFHTCQDHPSHAIVVQNKMVVTENICRSNTKKYRHGRRGPDSEAVVHFVADATASQWLGCRAGHQRPRVRALIVVEMHMRRGRQAQATTSSLNHDLHNLPRPDRPHNSPLP